MPSMMNKKVSGISRTEMPRSPTQAASPHSKSELQNMDSKNRNQIPVYAVPMQEAAGRSQHASLCRSPTSVNMHMSARSRPRSLRMDIPLLSSG